MNHLGRVFLVFFLVFIGQGRSFGKKFSPSDVSFFLPIPLNPGQSIKILEKFDGKTLFSIKLWKQLKQVPNPFLTTTSMVGSPFNPGNFYISSFRYSPCEPHIFKDLNPKQCKLSVLRIVAQSFSSKGDNPPDFFTKRWGLIDPNRFFHDSALHLIYFIPPEKRKNIEQALLMLKEKAKSIVGVSTKGAYLGVHPGFKNLENPKSSEKEKELALSFFNIFKKALYSLASTKNLIAVSEMRGTRNGNIGQWIFAGNLRDMKSGKLISKDITGLIKGENRKTHVANFAKGIRLGPKFMVDRDKVGPVDDALIPEKGKGSEMDGLKRIYKVLNPEQTIVVKSDCVSCHLAAPLLSRKIQDKGQKLGLSKAQLKQLEAFKYSTQILGEKNTLDPNIIKLRGNKKNGTFLILNFGRCPGNKTNQKLCISQRTLNETLEVVKFLNN